MDRQLFQEAEDDFWQYVSVKSPLLLSHQRLNGREIILQVTTSHTLHITQVMARVLIKMENITLLLEALRSKVGLNKNII